MLDDAEAGPEGEGATSWTHIGRISCNNLQTERTGTQEACSKTIAADNNNNNIE